jgi:carboxymethylenebutenolidase
VETTIPAQGTVPAMPAWAELPAGADRGVVIIHEIAGRTPEIDRVAARFSARGYAAVVPDLFAEGFLRCVSRAMVQAGTGKGPEAEKVRRARDWLAEQGVPADRIGVVGFCLGGGFAMAAGPGFAVASGNYGFVPDDDALKEGGPLIACYGARDRMMRNEPDKLRERLAALGRPGEVHVFPTASHSFLTEPDGWMRTVKNGLAYRYDAEVADEAWERIFGFFERALPTALRAPG